MFVEQVKSKQTDGATHSSNAIQFTYSNKSRYRKQIDSLMSDNFKHNARLFTVSKLARFVVLKPRCVHSVRWLIERQQNECDRILIALGRHYSGIIEWASALCWQSCVTRTCADVRFPPKMFSLIADVTRLVVRRHLISLHLHHPHRITNYFKQHCESFCNFFKKSQDYNTIIYIKYGSILLRRYILTNDWLNFNMNTWSMT